MRKFNSATCNKLLIHCDEASSTSECYKMNNQKLKVLITTDKCLLEHKGKDSVSFDDYKNYIFTSNQIAININE